MIYSKLNTRSLNSKFKKQNITKQDIINILKTSYLNTAFSTFPYLVYNSSSESIKNMKSGNCIALSMHLQKTLKKMNIDSYLIPATIPKMYQYPGLLEISHVAVAIPISPTKIFIVDTAFYFMEPLIVNINKSRNENITSVNIHESAIFIVESTNKITNQKLELNKYQTIPRGTIYIECNYNINKDDKWKYFLRQVVNPDLSIGKFFLHIKNQPWITITDLDQNGLCRRKINLKILPNSAIEIKKYNEILYHGLIADITDHTIDILNKIIYPYFGRDIRDFLNRYLE